MRQQALNKLTKKWYKKLADSGFKDIEDSEGRLKTWSGTSLKEEMLNTITSKTSYSSKLFKESQAEYYRLAAHYYHSKSFKSSFHKKIWKLHSKGATSLAISTLLNISNSVVKYHVKKMREKFYNIKGTVK